MATNQNIDLKTFLLLLEMEKETSKDSANNFAQSETLHPDQHSKELIAMLTVELAALNC